MKIPSDNSIASSSLLDSASRIDALARGGAPGTEGLPVSGAVDAAPATGRDGDPAESMLALDVWSDVPAGARHFDAQVSSASDSGTAIDPSALVDRMADSVMSALSGH